MKKFLAGLGLVLVASGALADSSAMEQSMKDVLASAKNKQSTSEFLRPQTTGPMLLRDALYLYNLPVYAGRLQTLAGFGCDVFQLVLDVESGYTDLGIVEGLLSTGDIFFYPDRIYAQDSMFAYALYSGYVDKGFFLSGDPELFGAPGVDPNTVVGRVTAFGYCFSTNPDAVAVYCLDDVCYLSDQVNPF